MTGNSSNQTDFSAADSALGYLYQVRLALLSSLQRLIRDDPFSIYLETLDDVVFERDGFAPDLLQTKHHCERSANLTNASVDLWKSFRVWMEGRANGSISEDAQLYLITTSNVGMRSSASYLTLEQRDETEALYRLRETVRTSNSRENQLAYQLFRNLSPNDQESLISSIIICPNAPNIIDVDDALRDEARMAVRREYLDSFLSRLDGWWYRRAIKQLMDPDTLPILSDEIESEIDDLREQFKPDSLPVDTDILEAEIEAADYERAIFVQQVKLVGVGNRRILAAIRDYYRAFTQRSRWVREDLLLIGELDRYERLLKEEWELQFDRVSDELGTTAAEDAKRAAAQKVYAWVEDSCFPIRPQVQHPSMTRGSFHILADSLQVGWHPEFMQRLQQILEPQEVS
ncbi:ABC-three component system protein [Adonisia turfae]|uniref:ABC-three component systems C-terminal domain-containing protein n=1 Tax=Adonisia turfae CCMR0081 TaxID=2292702 RepID=A0A6M0RZD2_9CYAN|nr:ABC-three component system protein [Adonisia turfae]NEZ61062.1 hypothetical protein [Adonisia turfae CCMR0081]